jgi:hypothetical protein
MLVTALDQSYAAADSRAGSTAPTAETQENIGVIFRSAIAAQPVLPHYFRLYFTLGSNELTPESKSPIALCSMISSNDRFMKSR